MGDIVRKLLSNSFVLFVIFIVIAIIIPLPSWLMDFMILLNISLSLIILVMTMFIKEALEFSVFPTVLLLTTVLRLSLNVSTTRGILSSGYAGEVISAFGNFVMGGDAIVAGETVFSGEEATVYAQWSPIDQVPTEPTAPADTAVGVLERHKGTILIVGGMLVLVAVGLAM